MWSMSRALKDAKSAKEDAAKKSQTLVKMITYDDATILVFEGKAQFSNRMEPSIVRTTATIPRSAAAAEAISGGHNRSVESRVATELAETALKELGTAGVGSVGKSASHVVRAVPFVDAALTGMSTPPSQLRENDVLYVVEEVELSRTDSVFQARVNPLGGLNKYELVSRPYDSGGDHRLRTTNTLHVENQEAVDFINESVITSAPEEAPLPHLVPAAAPPSPEETSLLGRIAHAFNQAGNEPRGLLARPKFDYLEKDTSVAQDKNIQNATSFPETWSALGESWTDKVGTHRDSVGSGDIDRMMGGYKTGFASMTDQDVAAIQNMQGGEQVLALAETLQSWDPSSNTSFEEHAKAQGFNDVQMKSAARTLNQYMTGSTLFGPKKVKIPAVDDALRRGKQELLDSLAGGAGPSTAAASTSSTAAEVVPPEAARMAEIVQRGQAAMHRAVEDARAEVETSTRLEKGEKRSHLANIGKKRMESVDYETLESLEDIAETSMEAAQEKQEQAAEAAAAAAETEAAAAEAQSEAEAAAAESERQLEEAKQAEEERQRQVEEENQAREAQEAQEAAEEREAREQKEKEKEEEEARKIEKQEEEAAKAREIADELAAQAEIATQEHAEAQQELDRATQDLEAAQTEAHETQQQVETFQADLDKAQDMYEESLQAADDLVQETERVLDEVDAMCDEVEANEALCQQLEEQGISLEEQIASDENFRDQKDQEAKQKESLIDRLLNLIQMLESAIQAMEAMISALEAALAAASAAGPAGAAKAAAIKAKLATAKSSLATLKSKLGAAKSFLSATKSALSALKGLIDSTNGKIQKGKGDRANVQSQQDEARTAREAAAEAAEALRATWADLDAQAEAAREQAWSNEEALRQVQEGLTAAQENAQASNSRVASASSNVSTAQSTEAATQAAAQAAYAQAQASSHSVASFSG